MNRQKKHGGMVEYSFPLVFLKLISMALYPVYDIDGSCKLKIQSENWNPRHNWDICQLPEVTRIIATRSRSHAICIWMRSIPSLLGRQTWRYEVNVSWHVICICISHESYYTRKVPMQCNFWYGLVHTILLKSQWVSSQPDWSIVSYCLETHSWTPHPQNHACAIHAARLFDLVADASHCCCNRRCLRPESSVFEQMVWGMRLYLEVISGMHLQHMKSWIKVILKWYTKACWWKPP